MKKYEKNRKKYYEGNTEKKHDGNMKKYEGIRRNMKEYEEKYEEKYEETHIFLHIFDIFLHIPSYFLHHISSPSYLQHQGIPESDVIRGSRILKLVPRSRTGNLSKSPGYFPEWSFFQMSRHQEGGGVLANPEIT